MLLQQTSTTWDLRYEPPPISSGLKLYMLFLFFICIITGIKVVRLWRDGRSARKRQDMNHGYPQRLQVASISLGQWIVCTFLIWGILSSIPLYDESNGLLASKTVPTSAILFTIEEFSTLLTLTLLVVFLLFLARWYVLRRLGKLRHDQP